MGISFSCPFARYSDTENGLESVIVKSINFGDEDVKTPVRSVSFNGRNPEPTILKSSGSGKMVLEGSVSFKGCELESMISAKSPKLDKEKPVLVTSNDVKFKDMVNQNPVSDDSADMTRQLPVLDPSNPKHEAAIKLQKVYKSFRTRRKLADCAVLVEQSWWKLLDFAELKRSSISYFDIEKHETAISRWSRARTRAAKVGKGLSKNDKARKLALQHWLEAIDPRHRYGHNLHFYYLKWLHCQCREPFFYWLDIGEGKEVNLDKCPRSKLQQQCIKYLGPMERKAYEVVLEDGKFFYKQTQELLHTAGENSDAKWIFVLSTSKNLYVGQKKKGTFQHSSFLAGGATIAAGRLVVESGLLKAVWPHSGHYQPTEENFKDFISFLEENHVDLTDVKMSPVDGEDDPLNKQRGSNHFRNNSAEEDLIETLNIETEEIGEKDLTEEKTGLEEQEPAAALERSKSRKFYTLNRNLPNLEVPKRGESFERSENEDPAAGPSNNNNLVFSSLGDGYETAEEEEASMEDGYETASGEEVASEQIYEVLKVELFAEQDGENEAETIPEETILRRINSKKGMKSYQLGKQLSCKWTTGAGPRIGCVRDYPSELQFRALEQVNLSPRSASRARLDFSPRSTSALVSVVSMPSFFVEEMTTNITSNALENRSLSQRSIQNFRMDASPLHRETSLPAVANVS